MSDSDWTKIIELLYENDGYYGQDFDELHLDDYGDLTPDSKEDAEAILFHGLIREAGLDGTESDVRDTLENLSNIGLITWNVNVNGSSVELKPEGFEVAHERELTRAKDETNRYLVLLTFVLVIVQIISLIPSSLGKGIASIIVLGGLLYLIYRLGIFEPAI